MAIVSINELQKNIPNEFSLFYNLQNLGTQRDLVRSIIDTLDAISIMEISKTCKFFYVFLKENRELLRKNNEALMQTRVFNNLNDIAKLPTISLSIDSYESLKPNNFSFPVTKVFCTWSWTGELDSPKLPERVIWVAFRYDIKSSNGTVTQGVEIIGTNPNKTSPQETFLQIIIEGNGNDRTIDIRNQNVFEPRDWRGNRLKRLLKGEEVGAIIELRSQFPYLSSAVSMPQEGENRCRLIEV